MAVLQQGALVHSQAVVFIGHVHMDREISADRIDYDRPGDDILGRQVDIPKLRRGGVKCIGLSEGGPGEVHVDTEARHRASLQPNVRPAIRSVFHGSSEVQRMLRGWDCVRRLCAGHASDLEFAMSAREVREIAARNKIAVMWHTESLRIANDLAMLRAYHALGLRMSGLVHQAPQDWIDSTVEQCIPGGLTDFGRQVIREMNALGIVIDVSHASDQAVDHILAESKHPVIASHSHPRHFSPITRNLTDDLIRRIAAGGGVIGIHASSSLSDDARFHTRMSDAHGSGAARTPKSAERLDLIGRILTPGGIEPFAFEAAERAKSAGKPAGARLADNRVGIERLVDVIDYLAGLAGVDHIGVGTDWWNMTDPVQGFESVADCPNLTAALLARGYSPRDVHKILGGNWLRVIEQVVGE